MDGIGETKRLPAVPLAGLVAVLLGLVIVNMMAGFGATTMCTTPQGVVASDCAWINRTSTAGMVISFIGAGVTLGLGLTVRRKAVPAFFGFLAIGTLLILIASSGG